MMKTTMNDNNNTFILPGKSYYMNILLILYSVHCKFPSNVSIMLSAGPNVDIDIVSINQNVIDIATLAVASHLTQDHSPLLNTN